MAGGDREVRGVVFLSNTMGSVEYAVVQDSSVYLKRGEMHMRAAAACVVAVVAEQCLRP